MFKQSLILIALMIGLFTGIANAQCRPSPELIEAKTVYNTLSVDDKIAVWKKHLEHQLVLRPLNGKQREVLRKMASELLTKEQFAATVETRNAKLEPLQRDMQLHFSALEAYEVFGIFDFALLNKFKSRVPVSLPSIVQSGSAPVHCTCSPWWGG